jgi:cytoskeleton protein RodZ
MTTAEAPARPQSRVGAVLRQLRDKRNLSVQDIAGQMRLDPRLVQALEDDNYRVFAADTYIRGYLRNYAKLLGVNGDELISLYQNDAPPPPEIIPDVKNANQVSSSDRPVKAFSYLITFILVLLLFIWWRQSDLTIYYRNLGFSSPDATTAPAASVPKDSGNEILQVMPDNTAFIPVDQSAPPEILNAAATSPETGSLAPPVASATAPMQPPESLVVPATGLEDMAMPGPDTVYIKLMADCWIHVRDRFDKEVYQNLARTGEELRLTGFAPFQVELGNAQGVIVEFNNRPYDPAPVTARGIARFTLGE